MTMSTKLSKACGNAVTHQPFFNTGIHHSAGGEHSLYRLIVQRDLALLLGDGEKRFNAEGRTIEANFIHSPSIVRDRRSGQSGRMGIYSSAMGKFKLRTEAVLGLAVACIWGLTFLSIKVAVVELKPMTLALSRFVIASVLLPLIALIRKTSLSVKARDLPLLIASGFIGVTLYFFFENNGIMRLSASESSIIIGTIPVLTLLVDMIFYRMRAGKSVVLGILISFGGVAVMVAKSETAGSSSGGYLFMIGAAVSWVSYTFLTKPLGLKYPLLSVTFGQIFFGMLGCIPFAMLEGQGFVRVSTPVLLNVVFLGVLASAVGYWLWVMVLDKLGASRSSVFINLIPVVSVAASFIVLGERLAPAQLVGGAATVIGVYLATKSA